MTIIDELTPVYYGLERGKLIVGGTSVAKLHFSLCVNFYNAEKVNLGQRYISLTFTTAQKTAFINAIATKLASLEAATGLTQYEPPPEP